MTILSQSLFTLVRSQFVALMLLSVRHNIKIYMVKLELLFFDSEVTAYLLHESLSGLERRNVVCGDYE